MVIIGGEGMRKWTQKEKLKNKAAMAADPSKFHMWGLATAIFKKQLGDVSMGRISNKGNNPSPAYTGINNIYQKMLINPPIENTETTTKKTVKPKPIKTETTPTTTKKTKKTVKPKPIKTETPQTKTKKIRATAVAKTKAKIIAQLADPQQAMDLTQKFATAYKDLTPKGKKETNKAKKAANEQATYAAQVAAGYKLGGQGLRLPGQRASRRPIIDFD